MSKYYLAIFLCLPSLFVYSQTNKKVEGTISIGCKVFNYTFTQNPQTLYSFYLEDIEKEGSLIAFSKEKISALKSAYENYITKIRVTDTTVNTTLASLDSVTKRHIALADVILNDQCTLLYWHTNRDSIKKLVGESKSLNLAKALNDSVSDTFFPAYLDTLEKTTTGVVEIFKSKTYVLNDFNQQSFVKLAEALIKRYRILVLPECIGEAEVDKIANALFFDIKARLDFADDQPITAKLKLKNFRVNVYYSSTSQLNTKEMIPLTKMAVRDVTAEFEDGTIKNLLADLVFDDDSSTTGINLPSRFKNITPISVSGRNDPDKFGKTKLFIGDPSEFYSKFNIKSLDLDKIISKALSNTKYATSYFYGEDTTTTKYRTQKETLRKKLLKKGQVYIELSELVNYYIEATNDNEDYSPANVVVHLNKNNVSEDLKKELRSKILSVRTYTDFVGLQGDQPNGLIQIEAARKFNLFTQRGGSKAIYIGGLTYFEPVFTISKIEKDRNAIPLSIENIDSFQLKNARKVLHLKTIDLLKYQNSTFDLNLNLAKINLPYYKSNFQVNLATGLVRTNVSDSVVVSGDLASNIVAPVEKTLTSFRWGFSVIYELKTDSRYGLLLGWDFRDISLLSKDYIIPVIPMSVTHSFWADAYLKTNTNSKLFFRYRITYNRTSQSDNFVQIQLGYLLDIFKTASK
jgi:hypothetical protein